jgi:hypothetical protein
MHFGASARDQIMPVFWSVLGGTTVSFLPNLAAAAALGTGACSSLAAARLLFPRCNNCGSAAAAPHAAAAVTTTTASSGHAAV